MSELRERKVRFAKRPTMLRRADDAPTVFAQRVRPFMQGRVLRAEHTQIAFQVAHSSFIAMLAHMRTVKLMA